MYWNVSYVKLVRFGVQKLQDADFFSTFPGWKKGAFLSPKIPKKKPPKNPVISRVK